MKIFKRMRYHARIMNECYGMVMLKELIIALLDFMLAAAC